MGAPIETITDRWISENQGSKEKTLHYLEKGFPSSTQPTMLYCPGNWEPAWRAIPLLAGLDGHSIAVTYRGHGTSFTPMTGYDLQEHVADLHEVVLATGANALVLVGFSRGVGYALGYLAAHPERVKGVVLMDAPPIHTHPGEGYVDYWRDKEYLGHRVSDHWRPEAMEAMAKEAREVHFPELMPKLEIPILILRGTDPDSPVPSNLSEEDITAYRTWLPQAQIVPFDHAGHMLLDEELGKCRKVIRNFLTSLEQRVSHRATPIYEGNTPGSTAPSPGCLA